MRRRSPTLAALSGAGGDVFAPLISPPGFLGPSQINQTISTLGLAASDELDAFSDAATGSAPEPTAASLLRLAMAALLRRRSA